MPLTDPGYAHRDALATRLRSLLADARRRGAVDPRLSAGEQTVVAALLSDPANPSTDACSAIAPSLWGVAGSEADAASGWARSWAWLRDLSR